MGRNIGISRKLREGVRKIKTAVLGCLARVGAVLLECVSTGPIRNRAFNPMPIRKHNAIQVDLANGFFLPVLECIIIFRRCIVESSLATMRPGHLLHHNFGVIRFLPNGLSQFDGLLSNRDTCVCFYLPGSNIDMV